MRMSQMRYKFFFPKKKMLCKYFFQIFRTINNYISSVISVATLVVNILLCILITREKKFINTLEMQK